MDVYDPTFIAAMYIVSYALAWYTWKDEKGWFSRIMKFLLTGIIPIVSLMLFLWKLLGNPDQGNEKE
jgi:uncharacterized membrane protein YfhO